MAKLITYILVAIFGSSSWLSINSVWMELSLIVEKLPEGWSLPSYLTGIIQIACIAPLFYSILHQCTSFEIPKAAVILGLLIFCTACSLLMAFFWDATAFVFGRTRSVMLIVIMFAMALVNTTSDVLFLPYMGTFHPTYLTAYFVGMGFSAFIPSFFSLIQGTSNYDCIYNYTTNSVMADYHPARFGVRDFNFIMFAWMLIAVLAFAMLHWGPKKCSDHETSFQFKETVNDEMNKNVNKSQTQECYNDCDNAHNSHQNSFMRYIILLGCLSLICAQMNGIVPSIQSYSTLSYTPLTYHFALNLGNLAQALACFLPLWFKPKSTFVLVFLTGTATAFCGYIFMLAVQSPTPILAHSKWGGVLSVMASVLAAGFQAYLRGVITVVVREDNLRSESRLFFCGLLMQIGSFVGACVMFPLVNYSNIFQSASPCANY